MRIVCKSCYTTVLPTTDFMSNAGPVTVCPCRGKRDDLEEEDETTDDLHVAIFDAMRAGYGLTLTPLAGGEVRARLLDERGRYTEAKVRIEKTVDNNEFLAMVVGGLRVKLANPD